MLSTTPSGETLLSRMIPGALGTFSVSVVLLVICTVTGFERGVPSAIILVSLSAGILSSAGYEKVAAKNGRAINRLCVVVNGILSVVLVYLLLAWWLG